MVLLILLAFSIAALQGFQVMVTEARAFFVFGDSLVDNGNNNYLPTTARADSPPYGIDYPTGKPTGRFSNGLNIPDLISEELGSETTLPILSPELKGEKLLVGANFASAGVGILNDTGIQFSLSDLRVGILRPTRQLQLFEEYQERLAALVGADEATKVVNQALVLITLGGNDFVNNYFLEPHSIRSQQYSLPAYCKFLIKEYRNILMTLLVLKVAIRTSSITVELQKLSELGARRVLVTGTGPLGCVPAERATRSIKGDCAPELQRAAAIFNPLLVQMTQSLNNELGSKVFIAANTGTSSKDLISNPEAFGFATAQIACCGQGLYNGIGLCTVASNLCPDRDIYVFWDQFHPTERAARYIVQNILRGNIDYMNPMNLSTILAMDSRV